MRLLVAASANGDIGRGRAMRCYAVAQAWMRLAPEPVVGWVGSLDFADVEGLVRSRFPRISDTELADWVLVDDPDELPSYWYSPMATFSDLGVEDLVDADLIINYAPYAHLLKFDCRALVGPKYTPIRDEIKRHGLPWVASCGAGLTALEHIYLGREPAFQCLANDQVAQWLWLRHEALPQIDGYGADRIVQKMLEMSGANET